MLPWGQKANYLNQMSFLSDKLLRIKYMSSWTVLKGRLFINKEGKNVITRAHCMRFIGQHVVFHTRDGVTHHGILHSVTGDGIYVRPIAGGTTRLANDSDINTANIDLLQNMPQPNDEVKEAFWPFLFFPLFALAALGAWGWWW